MAQLEDLEAIGDEDFVPTTEVDDDLETFNQEMKVKRFAW